MVSDETETMPVYFTDQKGCRKCISMQFAAACE